MSKKSLIHALTRGSWLVHETYITTYAPLVAKFLNGEPVAFFDDIEEKNAEKAQPFAIALTGAGSKIFQQYDDAPPGSISVIPVNGPILKEDNCGAPGTATLGERLKIADSHPNISAHILKIDSGGGSVDGTMDFANIVKASTKPVVAFIDGMMASAAYWIGSSASELVANNETAQIGSIGTAITLYDNRAALEKYGYKMIYINADSSPDKNQDYFKALDGDTKPIKDGALNPINEIFHSAVKTNREGKLKMNGAEPLTGKVYLAKQAISNGLIDHIGNFDFAVKRASELASEHTIQSTNQIQNNTMKLKAAFTAILAFLANAFPSFKAEETVLTEEHLEKMNSELATLADSKKKLADAEADVTRLTNEKATLQTAHDELKAENDRLSKLNPGATSVIKKGNDTTTSETKSDSDFTCEVDEELKAVKAKIFPASK